RLGGYIYGLEYSPCFSLSIHLFLILEGDEWDPNVVSSVVNWHWVHRVNGGGGTVQPCANHPNRYKNAGHGVMCREDIHLHYEVLASLAQWAKLGLVIPASEDLRVVRVK